MELWDREEFQPVAKFLCRIMDESLSNVRILTPEEEAVITKAKLMKHIAVYNLAHMLVNLPSIVKTIELNQEKITAKKEAFKNSQEGGNI